MKKLLSLLLFLPILCFSQIVISDLPSGGSIGTAANTVNKGSLFHINQTTSGQTLTVPNPTATNFSKFIYILDIGSASFTLSPGGALTPGTGVILVWTGTNWNVAGNGSPPTGSVTQSITNGDIDHSPSGDAVFDALALKENSISTGTALQYWRGDKTWQVLDKNAVGLDNVDNTSDLNKPVSTAQAAADALKVTANASITGATKAKITYDSKGLVTSGADLVASDIPTIPNTKVSGLGGAATLNVGTTSGTVCAGDDNRIKGFNIINYSTAFSPADATTYYLGSVGTMTTTTNGLSNIARRKYINVTGTITSAQIYIINGTLDATTETSTLYIRINDATDYLISNSIQFSATSSGKVYNITGLNIPITAGDYEVSKLATAIWATNPANTHMEIVYEIR